MISPLHATTASPQVTIEKKSSRRKKSSSSNDAATSIHNENDFGAVLDKELTAKEDPPIAPAPLTRATGNKPSKQTIARLISECENEGQSLLRSPTLSQYTRYRHTLETFLKTVLPHAFALQQHHSEPDPTSGTQREYLIIQTASEELQSLLTLIRETHQDRLALAASIDRLNGLMLDLSA